MNKPVTLSPLVRRRKALLVEHGITLSDIATEAEVVPSWVSQVVNGLTEFETPKTKRVKQLIAERVGVAYAELWPAEDASGNGSNSQADGEATP